MWVPKNYRTENSYSNLYFSVALKKCTYLKDGGKGTPRPSVHWFTPQMPTGLCLTEGRRQTPPKAPTGVAGIQVLSFTCGIPGMWLRKPDQSSAVALT